MYISEVVVLCATTLLRSNWWLLCS